MTGTEPLRAALADLMRATFLEGSACDPAHMVVSSGCSAVLDNLFYCLGDAGGSVLIPSPYYPAFDNDLEAKCLLRPVPVPLAGLDGSASGESIAAQLDAAAAAAEEAGAPVCALLVTNPNNPLGTVYPPAVVEAMVRWCLANCVHYVR